jgi:hypothetical protein
MNHAPLQVPLRSLRLDDYEESLATRVRMLQKSFPEVAEEIADAVYEYAGRIGSDESGAAGLEKVAVEASGDASRRPVDVAAATRVVEELEAASMSVLMHGKIPTGAALRAWLDDVVDGRGAGRGAWREDNAEFFRGESRRTRTRSKPTTLGVVLAFQLLLARGSRRPITRRRGTRCHPRWRCAR